MRPGKPNKCITKKVPCVGDLVVIRSKDDQIKTIIKLSSEQGANALGWRVFSFNVVHGVTDMAVFSSPSGESVEVCVSLLESGGVTDVDGRVVFRPYHAHVETSSGSNTYHVYQFVRYAMAMKLVACASRFGLKSFLITNIE